jgi:hypothetical protein
MGPTKWSFSKLLVLKYLLADYNLASGRIKGPIYWKGIKHYRLHGKECTKGMAYIYFTNEVTNAFGKRYAFMCTVRLHISLKLNSCSTFMKLLYN